MSECFQTIRDLNGKFRDKFSSAKRENNNTNNEQERRRDRGAEKYLSDNMRERAGQSFGVSPEEVIALW